MNRNKLNEFQLEMKELFQKHSDGDFHRFMQDYWPTAMANIHEEMGTSNTFGSCALSASGLKELDDILVHRNTKELFELFELIFTSPSLFDDTGIYDIQIGERTVSFSINVPLNGWLEPQSVKITYKEEDHELYDLKIVTYFQDKNPLLISTYQSYNEESQKIVDSMPFTLDVKADVAYRSAVQIIHQHLYFILEEIKQILNHEN